MSSMIDMDLDNFEKSISEFRNQGLNNLDEISRDRLIRTAVLVAYSVNMAALHYQPEILNSPGTTVETRTDRAKRLFTEAVELLETQMDRFYERMCQMRETIIAGIWHTQDILTDRKPRETERVSNEKIEELKKAIIDYPDNFELFKKALICLIDSSEGLSKNVCIIVHDKDIMREFKNEHMYLGKHNPIAIESYLQLNKFAGRFCQEIVDHGREYRLYWSVENKPLLCPYEFVPFERDIIRKNINTVSK